jgi:hypothetical protein
MDPLEELLCDPESEGLNFHSSLIDPLMLCAADRLVMLKCGELSFARTEYTNTKPR